MRKFNLLGTFLFSAVYLFAQNPLLLKDVNAGAPGSSIQEIVKTSNLVFFNALDGSSTDRGLYRTDGTVEGTLKLALTYPTYQSTKANKITALGDKVVFAGDNLAYYGEVWVSNGSQAGTIALERVQPTAPGRRESIYDLEAYRGHVYYGVHNTDNHFLLKRTAGNPGDMTVVYDFGVMHAQSEVTFFTVMNDILYFLVYDTGTGFDQLWRSDGTTVGTYLVKNFGAEQYLASYLMPTSQALYFIMVTPGVGDVLWKSDGTLAGTVAMKTINASATRLNDYPAFAANGSTLFFSANDNMTGKELWRTDGTAGSTTMVADIFPGADGSAPSSLTVLNGSVFFAAQSSGGGRELYRYIISTNAASLVKDIHPGTGSSNPSHLVASNNALLFQANNGVTGAELWISDGTSNGTKQVADVNPGAGNANPSLLAAPGNNLYFSADNGVNGSELFRYDNKGGLATGITYQTIYVNDNSTAGDVYTSAIGNDANPGTPEAPVATITKAVSMAQAGYTIVVDAGMYTEQVTIDKGLVLKGAGSNLTTIALPATGLLPAPGFGEYGIVQTAAAIDDMTVQDLTLDGKNIGAAGPVWGVMSQTGGAVHRCEIKNMANNGVFIRYTGTAPKSVMVSNNYIHHFNYVGIDIQGTAITANVSNNKVDGTGGPFVMAFFIGGEFGPLTGAVVSNNDIPFYNGWGIKINSVNGTVSQNSLTGTATAIQNENGSNIGATCNWFGTADEAAIAAKVTGNTTYTPWLVNGTDANTATGFQPLNNVCTGQQTQFYVNDNSQTGDRFTTAIGNDDNPGTKDYPFATLSKAYTVAPAGSTIYMDAGTYNLLFASYSYTKAMKLVGANFDRSPNDPADKRQANTARNPESVLTNFTAIIQSRDLSFEGFTIDVGEGTGFSLNNVGINNDLGNFQFKKNSWKINSHSTQFLMTGQAVTSSTLLPKMQFLIEDNRFEKSDSVSGTTFQFSFVKNIVITDNAFVVTGSVFRRQTAMSFGNTGIVDSVTVTNNLIDHPSTAINGPRLRTALIAGNVIDNSATAVGLGNAIAEGTAITIRNNSLTNTTGGTPFILYNRTGTSLAGTANSLLLENNTVTGILPQGITNQFAAFLNLTFNNSVLNPSVTIRGNKIAYSGDFSQSYSFGNRPLTVRGNIKEVTISENEIVYTGGIMLPNIPPNSQPPNPAITINTDWNNIASMPNNATVVITNNIIKGFKQSVVFYDPTSTGKDTYVGYGNIYFGGSVNVNNNSFTGDSISINNGTIGAAAAIQATCNWYGATSGFESKLTSEVNYSPWLVSGTDASTATGFQPLNNVCVGPQTQFYVNDNSTTGDMYTTGVGKDENPGTKEYPFATIGKAIDVATPGSTIYVDAGRYFGQLTINKSISVKGAGMSKTFITREAATDLIPIPGSYEPGIIQTTTGIGDVFIDDVTVDGSNGTTTRNGPTCAVVLQTGGAFRNSEIKNMLIQAPGGMEGNGLYVYSTTEALKTIIITGNKIQDIQWVGLSVQGNLASTIENNTIDIAGQQYGMAVSAGAWGPSLPSLLFRNNELKNYTGFGLNVKADQLTITNNSFTGSAQAIMHEGSAIEASCNWFGTASYQSIRSKITSSSSIGFSPWLTNGTNTSTTTGFLPTPGSCNGTIPLVSVTGTTHISCRNGNNGAVDITVTGGGTPYTYAWTKEGSNYTASLEDPSDLTAGTYRLLLTDAYGSTTNAEVTLTEPAMVLNASATGANVLCFGAATGSATVMAEGGTAPYNYRWSNDAVTATVSGLAAGTYSVTVTDANGCITTTAYTVTQPPLLTAMATGTSTACTNNASVSVSGGVAPYTYLWNNQAITPSISEAPAGTYSVTVTDANGCTATSSVVLNRQAFNPSTQVTDVSCFGGSNGAITISNANGTAPFTYSLNNGAFQASNTFSNLAAGTYNVAVKDANGCMGFATRTISQPIAMEVMMSALTQTCDGQANGGLSITVSGGTPVYTFAWTGPNGFTSTKQNLTGLATGNYQVLVTDKNVCTAGVNATVSAFTAITNTALVTNVACRGEANGSIIQNIGGGSGAGFTYSWNTGATTKDLVNLTTGNYSVTIRDVATGCTVVKTFSIQQPAAVLALTTSKTNVAGCTSMGTITATGSGGTTPYQYKVNNGNYQSSGLFTGLTGGNFTVWTMDANGCAKSALVTLTDNGSDQYESNNSKNAAKAITIGEVVSARIALSTDAADWFMFTTPAGNGQYTISVNHPSVNYALAVYPATKNAAALVPTAGTGSTLQYVLNGNTTYYISITGGLSYSCYNLLVLAPYTVGTTSGGQTINPNVGLPGKITTPLAAVVYPNPHRGTFTIQVTTQEEGVANVELFMANGQKFAGKRGLVRKGNSNFFLFSNAPQGLLFYKVSVGGKETNGKITGIK